jgi:Xaa-Pro aminopeptidase
MNYRQRQHNLNRAMSEQKLDAFLVTHPPNLAYLCGFTGSAGVLLSGAGRWALYTDGRYTEQARREVQGIRIVTRKGSALAAVAADLSKTAFRTIGIEAERLTVAVLRSLASLLPKRSRLVETAATVERLRMLKEPGEIERIRAAVAAGAALLEPAIKAIAPGVPETAVAAEMEYAARKAGADGMSFETIVAAGARSALPHGRASSHPIPRDGFVVLDFGVVLGGYCSDRTRTVHVGRPNAEMRALYDAVLAAQLAAIEAVRPGVEAGKVDAAARRSLRRERWTRFFTHSTGHGVGMEVHEMPRVGRGATDVLQPGMIITVEPGLYLPGKGGVRIEDMVLVNDHGAEVLTPASKELVTL